MEVLKESYEYLDQNNITKKIGDLLWAYQSSIGTVPHTHENLWSGHFFPATESQEELQVSCNLCLFGFYKQAMVSLRSALELGLLSVYWNIEDNGHLVIKSWLKSQEDTPRFNDVWKKLEKNESINQYQQNIDLKSRLLSLGYLHNYVHSKGHKYSNYIDLLKSNCQTFLEKGLLTWLSSFEEVIKVIVILHFLKYPVSTIEYEYERKFGIDIPAFGNLDSSQLALVEKIIDKHDFEVIKEINENNQDQKDFLSWLNSLPDLSEEEKEEVVINLDKLHIEQMGFNAWVEQEEKLYGEFWKSTKITQRVQLLEKWAVEMGYMKSKLERMKKT
jgi:hypothetical protein